jgi:hypothetical protein
LGSIGADQLLNVQPPAPAYLSCRKFFEALYDALIAILDDAFDRLKKRPDIEREVGSLFRSKHFNLYKRRNQPPR